MGVHEKIKVLRIPGLNRFISDKMIATLVVNRFERGRRVALPHHSPEFSIRSAPAAAAAAKSGGSDWITTARRRNEWLN